MFRNDAQLARVCELLCARVGKPGMWQVLSPTSGEATDTACDFKAGNPWSHGERLMFDVAWAVWNQSVSPDFGELINVLDSERLALLGRLLIAIAGGSAAIDRWLAEEALT